MKTNVIIGNVIISALLCSRSPLLASTLLFVVDVALVVSSVVVSGFQWQQDSQFEQLSIQIK